MLKKNFLILPLLFLISHYSYADDHFHSFYLGIGVNKNSVLRAPGADIYLGYEIKWNKFLYNDYELFAAANSFVFRVGTVGARIFTGLEVYDGIRIYGNAGYIYNSFLTHGLQLGAGSQIFLTQNISLRAGANVDFFRNRHTVCDAYLSAIYHFSL